MQAKRQEIKAERRCGSECTRLSQITWDRMTKLADDWLPSPRIPRQLRPRLGSMSDQL